MYSVQRCPHSMEQCLPSKEEGDGTSGASKADPEHLLACPIQGRHPQGQQSTNRRSHYTQRTLNQTTRIPATPISAQTATQRPEEAMEPTAPDTSTFGQTKPQGPLSIDPSSIVQTSLQTQTQIGAQAPSEATITQTPGALSVEEDWATPATQQEPTQQLEHQLTCRFRLQGSPSPLLKN
jgi:hypothetical protein